MYAREDMSEPDELSVFFPMLDEMGFSTYLLSAIDLFIIWSLINLSIGVAVLYKRQTGSVASGFTRHLCGDRGDHRGGARVLRSV